MTMDAAASRTAKVMAAFGLSLPATRGRFSVRVMIASIFWSMIWLMAAEDIMASVRPIKDGIKISSGTIPGGSVARNMPATAVTINSITTPGLVRAR